MSHLQPELDRAEAEVALEEQQLDDELQRLDEMARELEGRQRRLRAVVAEAAGVAPVPLDLAVQLQQAQSPVPHVSPGTVRERSAALRRQAIDARREAVRLLKAQLAPQQQQLKALARQLAADEAGAAAHLGQVKAVALKVAEAARKLGEESAAAPRPTPIGRIALTTAPRREQPRVRMQVKIDFGSENNFYSGFSTNISDGGVFIATVKVAAIGTSMDLFFRLPNGDAVEATGVVRWVREVDDLQPDVLPGLGVQFVKLDERARAAILNFVKSREPMFYPD